jgi:hypothetical protein
MVQPRRQVAVPPEARLIQAEGMVSPFADRAKKSGHPIK